MSLLAKVLLINVGIPLYFYGVPTWPGSSPCRSLHNLPPLTSAHTSVAWSRTGVWRNHFLALHYVQRYAPQVASPRILFTTMASMLGAVKATANLVVLPHGIDACVLTGHCVPGTSPKLHVFDWWNYVQIGLFSFVIFFLREWRSHVIINRTQLAAEAKVAGAWDWSALYSLQVGTANNAENSQNKKKPNSADIWDESKGPPSKGQYFQCPETHRRCQCLTDGTIGSPDDVTLVANRHIFSGECGPLVNSMQLRNNFDLHARVALAAAVSTGAVFWGWREFRHVEVHACVAVAAVAAALNAGLRFGFLGL